MKKVRIFVKTSICGPSSARPGRYAAIVECITSCGPVTREITGSELETTYNRSTLQAIMQAMMILKETCSITIYTDNVFVKNTIEQGRPEQWRRSEWKKPTGETVKNEELWKQYMDLQDGHEIAVRFSKHSDYSNKLSKMLAEEKKKTKNK